MRLPKLPDTSHPYVAAYGLLLPAIMVTGVFIVYPIIITLYTSFFQEISFLPKKFVGLKNYSVLLQDAQFLWSLQFTLLFTFCSVCGETFFGLLFASLLHEKIPFQGVFRTLVLIPWALPTIISAKIWKLLFDYSYGLLNYLASMCGLIATHVHWIGGTVSAFWALCIAEIWKTTPFMVILFLAGLQAIPKQLYEQAKIDGAGMVKRFFSITIPLLRPIIIVALIFRTIDSLRMFDLVYVLTSGGPGSSTKTITMIGFEMYINDNFGKGSCISMVIFLIVFIITGIYVKIGKFNEQFQ